MDQEHATPEESTLQGLPVKLEVFEGPLDLLLHLIRENKVEITDIPIASITEQYLTYLDLMRSLNLDVAGEFLVVAATLMHIKSRMLLPPGEEEEGPEEGEDPREELVRQLREYELYKEAGLSLRDMEERRSMIFGRESVGPEPPKRTDYPLEVSLFELLSALRRLMEEVPEAKSIEISRDRLTISEKIADLLERLRAAEGEVPFESLFSDSGSRPQIIVTFLAVLELIRLRMIRARQVVPGGEITVTDIRPRENGEDAGEPGETPAPAMTDEPGPAGPAERNNGGTERDS